MWGTQPAGKATQDPEQPCVVSSLRFLAAALGAAMLCVAQPDIGPERRPEGGRQAACRRQQGCPEEGRRIRRSREASGRPGRQSRMPLARPAGGEPALAGRSRYRLSTSRSVRPVRLPGGPYPDDVPLRRASGKHRSEGDRYAQQPSARLLDQSRAPRRRARPPRPAARPTANLYKYSGEAPLSCTDVQND